MPRGRPPWQPPDANDLVRRYQAGESLQQIADSIPIARSAIRRVLRGQGVEIHPQSVDAAHAARRGQVNTGEHVERIAAWRATTGPNPTERALGEWLAARHEVIYQHPVGRYNLDMLVAPVAVEVFGGHWHGSGTHRARHLQRTEYLFDRGLNVIVVWVRYPRHPLLVDAADQVVAFVEQSRSDPAFRRQHRMIWGDGEPMTTPSLDFPELIPKPAS